MSWKAPLAKLATNNRTTQQKQKLCSPSKTKHVRSTATSRLKDLCVHIAWVPKNPLNKDSATAHETSCPSACATIKVCVPVWWDGYNDEGIPTSWKAEKKMVWDIRPRNLTWNLKIMVSKWAFLFQGLIFRFHVKFRGCTPSSNLLASGIRNLIWRPWKSQWNQREKSN